MSDLKRFMIRLPNGEPSEVEGIEVQIPCLPGWRFFARDHKGFWCVTEVRSGLIFPPSTRLETMEESVAKVEKFCLKQGPEECIRVFMKVIDKFGDLPTFAQ